MRLSDTRRLGTTPLHIVGRCLLPPLPSIGSPWQPDPPPDTPNSAIFWHPSTRYSPPLSQHTRRAPPHLTQASEIEKNKRGNSTIGSWGRDGHAPPGPHAETAAHTHSHAIRMQHPKFHGTPPCSTDPLTIYRRNIPTPLTPIPASLPPPFGGPKHLEPNRKSLNIPAISRRPIITCYSPFSSPNFCQLPAARDSSQPLLPPSHPCHSFAA